MYSVRMTDVNYDPYASAKTDEDRQRIYQDLLIQHEQAVQVYEHKKKIYDDSSRIWDAQRDIQLKADARFTKNILTIAAGSFGVSFIFINQIVSLAVAVKTNILMAAWLLFGFSIIFAVLEPRIVSVIQDKLLDELDIAMKKGEPHKEINERLVMVPTRVLKWLAFSSFAGGVLCLLSFVYINIVIK